MVEKVIQVSYCGGNENYHPSIVAVTDRGRLLRGTISHEGVWSWEILNPWVSRQRNYRTGGQYETVNLEKLK